MADWERELWEAHTGVWTSHYTVRDATGEIVDEYDAVNDIAMDIDRNIYSQRNTYTRGDEVEVRRYTAHWMGRQMVIEGKVLQGTASAWDRRTILLHFAKPSLGEESYETIVLMPRRQSRPVDAALRGRSPGAGHQRLRRAQGLRPARHRPGRQGPHAAGGPGGRLTQPPRPHLSEDQHWLDGQPCAGDGEEIEVHSPSTDEPLTALRAATPAQVDDAVEQARETFEAGAWRRKASEERASILEAAADEILSRKEALTELIVWDNGKTLAEAESDVWAAAGIFRRSAYDCRQDRPETVPPERGVHKTVVREPVGVVAGITPFNAPLPFTALKAAPALAAGNSVVLKPSERSPLLAQVVCRAATQAGVPRGVISLVHGRVETAAALVAHDDVDLVSLTGGTTAGAAVMRAAAPTLKNLILELGGKSAHIVLADADLDTAIPAVAAGIFKNAGQRCLSGSRLVVEESIADRVENGIAEIADSLTVGNPFDPETQVGAMIDEAAVEAVEAFVERSRADGLVLRAGGERPRDLGSGSFYRPTLLTGAGADSFAARTEIFGPILTSIRVADVDEAVAVANRSRYGLAGGVWSENEAVARRVANEVRTGVFWINTYAAVFGDVPFGGYGHSGIGREAGRWGYEAYTELKSILHDCEGGGSAASL